MKSIISKLKNELKNDEIADIVIFGSYMKGKDNPNDIDLLIIFKEKINKDIEYGIKKKLSDKFDINSITLKEFMGDDFIAKEGIFLEGYSISKNKRVSEILSMNSFALIKYNISEIKGSNRTRFYYALLGRNNNEGFLKRLNAKKLSDNIIICKYEDIEKVKEFLYNWNIEYEIIPALIPSRLKEILLK